jgi:MFS transporter, ACDE family, multidrug resistance protein
MIPNGRANSNDPPFPPSRQLSNLLVLFAAGCLTTMTGGIISPVLPEMVEQLHLSPQWAGTLVSMHALTIALSTPLLGILADRVGNLRVMIPALVLYGLFGTAGAFMQSFFPLLLMRGLLGAASGGVAAASIGMLGSMYEGDARSQLLGYATSAMTTVSIIVPLVGGWVGREHWQYAFYLYGFGIPLALIAAFVLPRKSKQSTATLSRGETATLIPILRQPRTLHLLLTLTLAAGIVYAVIVYTPLYLKATIGADSQLNGVVLALRGVGAAIASAVVASRLAKWMGVAQAIALGFFVMAVTLVTLPHLEQLSAVMAMAVLFGLGFGITVPNLYDGLANQAPPELRSSVLSLGTGGNSLGQFLSPVLLGPIWHTFGFVALFYVAAGISLAVGCLNLLDRQRVCR